MISDVASGVLPLLTADGSFWLHVNDRQLGAAQAACDSVFGRDRFVGTITWERTRRPSFIRGRHLASTTDFLLIYARDRRKLRPFTDGLTEVGKRVPVTHRGNTPTRLEFPAGSVRFNCPDGIYPAGDHSSPGITAELLEDVAVIGGMNASPLRLLLPSRYSRASVQRMVEDGAQFLIPKPPFRPSYLAAGGRAKVVSNVWSWRLDDRIPTNEDAHKDQLRSGISPFPYAKPVGLLRRILEVATEPGDSVLDPFGGSGTTAEAARLAGRAFVLIEQQSELIEHYVRPRLARAGSVTGPSPEG